MNPLPYQPLFWGDVLVEMTGMDLQTQAAYMRLRAHYWLHGPLTNDFEELRGIVGATKKQWTAIYSKALKQFVLGSDGRLHNAKLDADFERALKAHERAHNRGKAGANARWNKDLADAQALDTSTAQAMPPIQSNPKRKNTPSVSPSKEPDGFAEWWDAFGKVGSKKDAIVAYDAALKRTAVNPSVLLAAARSYHAMVLKRPKEEHKYHKHGQGWLNGDMWEGQAITPEPKPDTRYNPRPDIPLPVVQW